MATEAAHIGAAEVEALELKKNTVPVLPEAGFFRLPDILRLYPVSRSTWWAGVKAGRFPKPVKLGERCTAWRVEDIRALIGAANAAKAAA